MFGMFGLAEIFVMVIGVIMLLAQVQLFTIAKEVKKIRELLEQKAKKD